MDYRIKKITAGVCAAVFMMTSGLFVSAEETDIAEEQNVSDTEDSGDDSYVMRTEQEVLKTMKKACENEKLRLWYSEDEDLLALENRQNGYIWWSSPVNAEGDPLAKSTIKKELESSLVLVYGQSEDRTVSTLRSSKNGKMKYSVSGNTLSITYRFPAAGLKIPVKYTLGSDSLDVSIETADIEENKKDEEGIILLELSVLPNIMSADSSQDGAFVIPDGSGALINFNNGKTNAHAYSGMVYGEDITAVSLNSPAVTEQVYLPVYASLSDSGNGMLAVIHEGDSSSRIQASVSGLSKSSYNICSSRFILRNTDTYYMNGEPLTVFEKGDISIPSLEMRFFPFYKKEIDFTDAAEVYRNYLTDVKGVEAAGSDISLCVDLYGGVQKKEPVLGVPVTKKKAVTTFKQACEIVSELLEKGAENLAVTLDNWTDDGITGKADMSAKPSSVLGSKKDFRKMTELFDKNNIAFYPVSDNRTFKTGNGLWTFTDTAMRASGQYSRQIEYNPAYGTQDGMKKPQSLLTPAAFGKIFSKLSQSYSKADIGGICAGNMTSVLYGSYGKNRISRDDSMKYITEGLEKCRSSAGSLLAQSANAYVIGLADYISDVPLSSSRFDIFDEDIPFVQTVLHGLVSYTTTSVNGNTDPEKLILMAAASGSGLDFDMVYEDISELKDTEYDKYYYADYRFWSDTAAGGYRFLKDVLADTENKYITGYEREENLIKTEYSDGTVLSTDLEKGTVSCKNKLYTLSDYLCGEGGKP